ncbi:MAG: hypothetical protein ACFFDQ_07960 [Candidatus Thorarchaeota archaeon]
MQFEWLFTIGIMNILLIIALFFIVNLLIQGIFLGIGLGFVNGQNRDLSTTFVTSLLMSLVIWIPCLGCFIAWYFIKSRHEVGWGGALVAWLLGGIIMFLVVLAIILFAFGAIWSAIFAGLFPGFP